MATLINPSPDILDNDLKLYRYWNFRGIIDASSNAIAAEMLGKKTSYITAIAGPNPSRAIGDDLTLKIEQVFHLPFGALDSKPDRRVSNEDPKIAEIARMMSTANDLDKELLLNIAKNVFGHSIEISNMINKSPGRTISGSSILSVANSKNIEDAPKNSDNR